MQSFRSLKPGAFTDGFTISRTGEDLMDSIQILAALERERQLLEDFICLSEEQLLLLENENVEAVTSLLQRRADLMVELSAIESTLGTWIMQIRNDPTVSYSML